MRKLKLTILFIFLSAPTLWAKDNLLKILKDELKQEMSELKKRETAPYHMSYRVIDRKVSYVQTSFGALVGKNTNHTREFMPQLRLGTIQLDNFKDIPMGSRDGKGTLLPLNDDVNEMAIRQAIWKETNQRYQFALSALEQSKAKKDVKVEQEDKAPFFSDVAPSNFFEAPFSQQDMQFDADVWENKLKEITALFKADEKILGGDGSIQYITERRYFVDSDGCEVVHNLKYARIMIQGMTKADDGMELPLHLSYFAFSPNDLPSVEHIKAETQQMIATLGELRVAPMVDPYTGPAILSGEASGVFFHEIFGHRIEGQRMKSDNDGQTFKSMVGEYVLPAHIQVFDDPTLSHYDGQPLNGYYKYDDQGVKSERVNVVVDGKLHDFLMTRTPIDNHPRSNGHARAERGLDPVSRQSNLIIESKTPKSDAELRTILISELKKQNKEKGYYFKEVTGGLTFTGKGGTNSFNVTPLVVYEVYADGRPDKLVRGVDLIGTPLSMFSNIEHLGKKGEVFTGMCGAESGSIPVTAISPAILVTKVEMQRKAKSQNIPPILSAPIATTK
ncbi:MAG: metallopeptidase TldD-related protein [Marinifilaceae bacterium]